MQTSHKEVKISIHCSMDGRMKTDTRHLTGFLDQQYQTICLKTIVKMVSRLRTWMMTQVLHQSGALTLTVNMNC